ncbi:hypothetical protein [Ideonella sp.]|uniref:hypothetical protein n=1 Tax=Ideonella sp. TaxID=1929293 RepID=UPI0035B14D0A
MHLIPVRPDRLPARRARRAIRAALPLALAAVAWLGAVQAALAGGRTVAPVRHAGAGVAVPLLLQSTDTAPQSEVPLSLGQVFARGDLPEGASLTATYAGQDTPVQLDVKARHADGSVRHAVVSAVLPRLEPGTTQELRLLSGPPLRKVSGPGSVADLLAAGFTAKLGVRIDGRTYRASAETMLRRDGRRVWLSGPLAQEWLGSAPLRDDAGVAHPHLSARFAVRWYPGAHRARVDMTIENTWAYEPDPQNVTYDVAAYVGGRKVHAQRALKHFAHARWRKTFWWGGPEPRLHVRHDTGYLVASGAVPHYDLGVRPSTAALDALAASWDAAAKGPMAPGLVTPAMPTTGGRADIAPLPQWAALYLLSMDPRAKAATVGNGELAGSWPIHYRDKRTGRPVSLADYPYMTLLGRPGDTVNPRTGLSEAFPPCLACDTAPYAYQPDSAHQPSLAYLPYLVTGDHYLLEELQFWANYNMLQANPHYRGLEQGLLKWDQVRGQAWSLRTLGHAAYITPDDDPMKAYFVDRLRHNLDWYTTTYVNTPPNALGVLDGSGQNVGPVIAYTTAMGPATGLAPWMDDFFTWSVAHLASGLGFEQARPLATWKSRFPVGRMVGAGYCWTDGAVYALAVRPAAGAPLYGDFSSAYLATMQGTDSAGKPIPLVNSTGARYLDQPCGSTAQADWRTQRDKDLGVQRVPWVAGEMTGYAAVPSGYPSNMQPALAAAVDMAAPQAQAAWDQFMARSVKPDYTQAPQWAIVPVR